MEQHWKCKYMIRTAYAVNVKNSIENCEAGGDQSIYKWTFSSLFLQLKEIRWTAIFDLYWLWNFRFHSSAQQIYLHANYKQTQIETIQTHIRARAIINIYMKCTMYCDWKMVSMMCGSGGDYGVMTQCVNTTSQM